MTKVMIMSIEEKINEETWEVLKQLKRDFLLTPKDRYVRYEVVSVEEGSKYPWPENQRKIVDKLENLGAIKILRKNYVPGNPLMLGGMSGLGQYGFKALSINIEIVERVFEKLFSEYEKKYAVFEIKSSNSFYVEKRENDFFYNGIRIEIGNNDPHKVFSTLYEKLPYGGEIKYEDLGEAIKQSIKKTKNYSKDAMKSFIQRNLTDKTNGFINYGEIKQNEDNGKPLISVSRGYGIIFNNQKA